MNSSSSSSDGSDVESPRNLAHKPQWYTGGPFLYNGTLNIQLGLPCAAVVMLAITGESLLYVIVIAALLVHLLLAGGAKQGAMAVLVCAVIVAQLLTLYSALPLLWISPWHLALLSSLNIYGLLTGALILLQFKTFHEESPDLLVFIEKMLFSAYPLSCCALYTYFFASLANNKYLSAPIFVAVGFVLLWPALLARKSSFKKQLPHQTDEAGHILNPVETALVIILYNVMPLVLFVLQTILTLDFLDFLASLAFLGSTTLLLSTFLNLRPTMEMFGYSLEIISWTRWIAGLLVLVLGYLCLLLKDLTYSWLLLGWLPWLVLFHLLLGFATSRSLTSRRRHLKNLARASAVILGLLYGYITLVNVYSWTESRFFYSLSATLTLIHAALCILSVLASNKANQQLFTLLLLTEMCFLTMLEHLLYVYQMYTCAFFVATSLLSIYAMERLYQVGKVSWVGPWMASGLHSTKLFRVISDTRAPGTRPSLSHVFFFVLLVLTLVKLFLFEPTNGTLTRRQALGYSVAVVVSIFANLGTVLYPILDSAVFIQVDNVDIVMSGLILCTVICLKISRMVNEKVLTNLNWNIILVGLVVSVLHFRVEATFTRVVVRYLFTGSLSLVASKLFHVASEMEERLPIFLQACIVGVPTGLEVTLLFSETLGTLMGTAVCYCIGFTMTTYTVFLLWHWKPGVGTAKRHRKRALLSLAALPLIFSLHYVYEVAVLSVYSNRLRLRAPCTTVYSALGVLVSLALNRQCDRLKNHSSAGQLEVKLNLAILVSYCLACLSCSLDSWEVWTSVASVLFLLMREDDFFVFAIRYREAPLVTATVCSFYLAAWQNSAIFNSVVTFGSFIELAILIVVLQVHLSICSAVLFGQTFVPFKSLVFIGPLNILLFPFGASYASWVLASLGIAGALWITYELAKT